jgi:hypothetical protein
MPTSNESIGGGWRLLAPSHHDGGGHDEYPMLSDMGETLLRLLGLLRDAPDLAERVLNGSVLSLDEAEDVHCARPPRQPDSEWPF